MRKTTMWRKCVNSSLGKLLIFVEEIKEFQASHISLCSNNRFSRDNNKEYFAY